MESCPFPDALRRDFYLEVSEGFVYNCLDWQVRRTDGAAYRDWTLAAFSGTLCLDEIHLGQKLLLLWRFAFGCSVRP